MKRITNFLLLAAVTAPLVIYTVRRVRNRRMRRKIADEGFETASDVLYPRKGSFRKYSVGPVLPQ